MIIHFTPHQFKVLLALLLIFALFCLRVPSAHAQDARLFSNDCAQLDAAGQKLCRRVKVVRYLQWKKQVENVDRAVRAQDILDRVRSVRPYIEVRKRRRLQDARTRNLYGQLKNMPSTERRNILNLFQEMIAEGTRRCRFETVKKEYQRCLVRNRNEARKDLRRIWSERLDLES